MHHDHLGHVGTTLNRDLAFLAAGVIAAGGLIGAGIGIAVDVLAHRHRSA